MEQQEEMMALLQRESELQEIVQLVGADALPPREWGTLEVARYDPRGLPAAERVPPVITYHTVIKDLIFERVYRNEFPQTLSRLECNFVW
jgi:hypothetical protein